MEDDHQLKGEQIYNELQVLKKDEEIVSPDQLQPLSENWKDPDLPLLQRKVVDFELENLRKGLVNQVYESFISVLKRIPMAEFNLVDVACATGYYYEVIRTLDSRKIRYRGSDYSPSMVALACSYYPDATFEVQDLSSLGYESRSFDVVFASGVLEHIPDYRRAILEMCRVSRRYVILHRCPLTSKGEHEYTIGSQYNIETPRIFYSWNLLQKDFAENGYRAIYSQDVYRKPREPFRWRSLFRFLRGTQALPVRTTRVFLMERI